MRLVIGFGKLGNGWQIGGSPSSGGGSLRSACSCDGQLLLEEPNPVLQISANNELVSVELSGFSNEVCLSPNNGFERFRLLLNRFRLLFNNGLILRSS